jgi:hypothetical protein
MAKRKISRRKRGGDENAYVVPKQDSEANNPAVLAPLLQARRSLRNPFPKEVLTIKTPKQFQQVKLTPTPKAGRKRKTRRHRK